MFFKMLKSDLKRKKSLNVILAIFMMVASVLMVASAIQVYANLAGKTRTFELCKAPDVIYICRSDVRNRETNVTKNQEWIDAQETVVDYHMTEMMSVLASRVDFPNFDESKNVPYYEARYYIGTQSYDRNVVYDINDECFHVENGCIAIPQMVHDMTGVEVGDPVRITTPMGNIYEFTVSHIFKDPVPVVYYRYLISEADYDKLRTEDPLSLDVYEVELIDGTDPFLFISDLVKQKHGFMTDIAIQDMNLDDSQIILLIVAIFMVLLSLFMMLIVFMTIRFTMVSAIKEEEKEIGMMKAIGVDSFRFRWLFAAKYIAFSILGGIVGVLGGIPISKQLLNMFSKNVLAPDMVTLLVISGLAVLVTISMILLFIILAMKHMKKISVMDAIHGENRGERFGKATGLQLHKRKKMPIPLYLAVTDIMNRGKRYIFLIISYTLAVTVILSTVHLRNTIMSETFMKFFLVNHLDFHLEFSEEEANTYISKTGSYLGMLDLVNQELEVAGIPAEIRYDYLTYGDTTMSNGEEIDVQMLFGDIETEEFTYRKGGQAPQLSNELALDYNTAQRHGLQIGDRITIQYIDKYNMNGTVERKKKEFIITGFYDYLSYGSTKAIMGNEFTCEYKLDGEVVDEVIHAPKQEHELYIEEMCELYDAETVQTTEEYMEYYMSDYEAILSLLVYVFSIVIGLVLILITSLYSGILLDEEIPTIAMMKSMGFANERIRTWQLMRMGILLLISIILGNVLVNTVAQFALGQCCRILGLTGFVFVVEPVTTYVLVPVLICGVVLVTLLTRLRKIKSIELWKIREE